jgi:hypothetical protein
MADENKGAADPKAAAAARDAAEKTRDAQLKDERKAADADTKEQLERTQNLQPTPTQEENDRARLGQSVEELDDKEDHGAEPIDERSFSRSPLNRSVNTK